MSSSMKVSIDPIGVIRSPFKEKFAIPRQSGLIKHAIGTVEFYSEYAIEDCLRGIENYSHIWLLFLFNKNLNQGWSPLVRPPRLGGNKKMGVFATRSSFRPNGIGMSVVKRLNIESNNGLKLQVGGIDLMDGTPIIDIKPYIPYADCIDNAVAEFASEKPSQTITVDFTDHCLRIFQQLENQYPHLKELIFECLAQDPRPAYKSKDKSEQNYGVLLYDFNVSYNIFGNICTVYDIKKC